MQKIQDYAIIGNGRSAALISRNGSIDWLCWPRFDSPSIFAGILDQQNGGSWKIHPLLSAQVKRHYIEGTNVLQTRFITDAGIIVITDCMSAFSEEEKQQSLQPEQEIIRRVNCEEGEVEIQILFDPKPNYGRDQFTIQDMGLLGLRIEIGRQLMTLQTEIQLHRRESYAWAQTKLKAGQRLDFSLVYTAEGPAVIPPLGDPISHKLALTINWWQKWSSQNSYRGPYQAQVMRSALALKLLGYAPSGAFIASPTTSLPERIGGDLNWDYRYCWLRDAAFTVRAMFGLGYAAEAETFVSWLLHSTRLTLPQLRVLYDVYGEDIEDDIILSHLKGYAGSSPVRIGNGVRRFFELDIYGEVIESVTYLVRAGGLLDHETQKMLRKFGEYICNNWQKPDTGIWEKMYPLKHYTHSKLMCWVALDRLIEIHKRGQIKYIPVETFTEHRDRIRRTIEEKSWNSNIESYTQTLEGEELDATVLTMPLYEFDHASSIRMRQTFQRVQERLSPAPSLIYRYEKSVQEGEGAFGLCSFWNVEFLARGGGSLKEAHQAFAQLLSYANDLGLFAEEIDPKTGDALGNFPQAFTHVGLINAALSLKEREKAESIKGAL
jgi:GH15 family glucan-1,4-alpha-glucosidase